MSSSSETNWIETRLNSFVFTFWYLTRTRKIPPKRAQNVILFSRGLSKEKQDEVDKMVRTSGFRRVASSFFFLKYECCVLTLLTNCCFDGIDDAQQLYDECYHDDHEGGRPTEVARLVKLGANGSGYKDDVRLPLVSSFSIVTTSLLRSFSQLHTIVRTLDDVRTPDFIHDVSRARSIDRFIRTIFKLQHGGTALIFAALWNKPKCVESMLSNMSKEDVAYQDEVRTHLLLLCFV